MQCPKKEKSEHVKWALCDGNHPANYKGCTVYKDIQQRTFPPLRISQDRKNQHDLPQPHTAQHSPYAASLTSHQHQYEPAAPHILQQSPSQTKSQPPTSDIQEMQVLLKGLMEQMSSMFSLLKTLVSKIT
jgi:hypothetical protein